MMETQLLSILELPADYSDSVIEGLRQRQIRISEKEYKLRRKILEDKRADILDQLGPYMDIVEELFYKHKSRKRFLDDCKKNRSIWPLISQLDSIQVLLRRLELMQPNVIEYDNLDIEGMF